ncbi:MAG: DUF5082 family protein [Psychrobacillus sp.]
MYWYMKLAEVKAKIARLNACQASLTGKQGEFQSNEPKCKEPELTPTTWHGTLATAFDDIRESGIRQPYLEIIGTQFSAVFDAITAKLLELQAEIVSIQATIDRLKAEEAANSMK